MASIPQMQLIGEWICITDITENYDNIISAWEEQCRRLDWQEEGNVAINSLHQQADEAKARKQTDLGSYRSPLFLILDIAHDPRVRRFFMVLSCG
jgi:hypothetical protein